MTDWKDNKGSGPWDFIEQSDKWAYLNNPRWSVQADAQEFCRKLDLPLNLPDKHDPCGHWHKLKESEEVFPAGKWVAAMQQPGTPYIYVYDIFYKAVIRIDASEIPVFVSGRLELDSLYNLDYDQGWGNPGAQRGGYCMNKDGTRIWYLFTESDGDRIDAELIEVDISKTNMLKIESTHFTNLMAPGAAPISREKINDGCSDNIHTYWCTNLVAGRIIKIQSSDHSIIDDHYFNYPIEGCGADIHDEAIATIDYNVYNQKLYWVYVRDHTGCVPANNTCRHLIRADIDLVADIDDIDCNSGLASFHWQNMIRIYSNHILHHRAYHPFSGYLMKRNLDYSFDDQIKQQYLQNILGVKNNYLFTLMHVGSIPYPGYLYCIDFSDMEEVSKLNVNYYAGQGGLSGMDWNWTSVSAMNQQTGVIAIFRYNTAENRNYVGCFEAKQSLGFLCDVPLHIIRHTNKREILNEPQSWPIEGFVPPEVPEPISPIEVISDPGLGQVIYEPSYPPDDSPDEVPTLQGGFSDYNISIGPGQTVFFKFEASVPDCDHPIQVSYTQKGIALRKGTGHCGVWDEGDPNYCRNCGPCGEGQGGCLQTLHECKPGLYCIDGVCQQKIEVHLLVKKGSKPTIADFERTWPIAPSIYNCDSGQWTPAKPAGEENFYWDYILANANYLQTELVEIGEPMGSDIFYIMLYNEGRQKVYSQRLTVSYTD